MRAKHVVLCGSEDGVVAARRLIERLGGRLDVQRFERKNPLRVVDAVPMSALRAGRRGGGIFAQRGRRITRANRTKRTHDRGDLRLAFAGRAAA